MAAAMVEGLATFRESMNNIVQNVDAQRQDAANALHMCKLEYEALKVKCDAHASEAEFWKAQCQNLKGEVQEGKEESRRLVSRIEQLLDAMVNRAVVEPTQLNPASAPFVVPNTSTAPHSNHSDSFRSGIQTPSRAIAESTQLNQTSPALPSPGILAAPHSNHPDPFRSKTVRDDEHVDDTKPSKSSRPFTPWPVMSSDGTSSTRRDEIGSEHEDGNTNGCDDDSPRNIANKLLRSIILAQLRTVCGEDIQMEYAQYWKKIVMKFNCVIEGWPADIPFTGRKTNYSDTAKLVSCWERGETRFRKLEEGEFELLDKEWSRLIAMGAVPPPLPIIRRKKRQAVE